MNENGFFGITNASSESSKFFCMRLITYLDVDFDRKDRLFRFHYVYDALLASRGQCRYKNICPIYMKTLLRNRQMQLKLF